MPPIVRRHEVGRGERVLPGLWRLRLPLPWPGIPHCNAWAIASGPGVVLVDCGMHQPGSIAQLELAMAHVNLKLEHVASLVITHAHSDHWGQAATVVDRSGCELWMHPNHAHATTPLDDPEATIARRIEVGRQSGVPDAALRRYAEQAREEPSGVARVISPDHELVTGVVIESDLGGWQVFETPGHAPSHVCLFQPERRLLISGDHVLGRTSLFFEYGFSPDPIAEFRRSMDLVDELDARLCLAGHGRTFTDVHAHLEAQRALVAQRLEAVVRELSSEPRTAVELIAGVFEEPLGPATRYRLIELLNYLNHLEQEGRIGVDEDGAGGSAPGAEAGVRRWMLRSG